MKQKTRTCVIWMKMALEMTVLQILSYEKALETLIRVSEGKDAIELLKYLLELKNSSQEVKGHRSCRRKFIDKRKMASKQIPTKRLNSSLEVRFNCKVQCFLCSKSIKFYSKHSYSEVMTLQLRESLIEPGNERNDEWGKVIACCLGLYNDLVVEDPKYHTNCMAKFHLKNGADREEDGQKMYRWLRVLEGHVVVDSKLSIRLQYIIR